MASAFLAQPLLSILAVMLSFSVMPWPGYVLLHALGYGRNRWSGATFAAPAVTLALWIVVLSGAAWASIPLHLVSLPLWLATLGLAVLGIVLRLSVRSLVPHQPDIERRYGRWLWIIAYALPLLVMPATFRYGLGTFVNSTMPDAWSYAMVSDYLNAVRRGADGGLSSLHQYAAHLMGVRNASSAILAQITSIANGIKADQTMTLFCLLVLFANTGALIAFARSIFIRSKPAIVLVVLAGIGWPANIIFAGNLDQILLLPLLPVIAAIALLASQDRGLWGATVVIGILGAAALYAYIELAFIGLAVAMTFAFSTKLPFRAALIRAAAICLVSSALVILLSWPGLADLLHLLVDQYAMATGTVRPGDGYFPGLSLLGRLPSAVMALGGEFARYDWFGAPWIVGTALCVATLAGAWSERRRWPVVMGLILTAAAFAYFCYAKDYSYGGYKIISVNSWMVSFFTVAGGIWLFRKTTPALVSASLSARICAAILLAIIADRTIVQRNQSRFKDNAVEQARYREALAIGKLVGQTPTLLTVRDHLANQWAVFYLSDTPLLIAPYRSYMAQAHVVPFMDRAKHVDPADIRFIVTDREETIQAPLWGARRVWDGMAYSLWSVDADWAVIAGADSFANDSTAEFPLPHAKYTTITVTRNGGPFSVVAELRAAPQDNSWNASATVELGDGAGTREVQLGSGQNHLITNLAPGKSALTIGLAQAPAASRLPASNQKKLQLSIAAITREKTQ